MREANPYLALVHSSEDASPHEKTGESREAARESEWREQEKKKSRRKRRQKDKMPSNTANSQPARGNTNSPSSLRKEELRTHVFDEKVNDVHSGEKEGSDALAGSTSDTGLQLCRAVASLSLSEPSSSARPLSLSPSDLRALGEQPLVWMDLEMTGDSRRARGRELRTC